MKLTPTRRAVLTDLAAGFVLARYTGSLSGTRTFLRREQEGRETETRTLTEPTYQWLLTNGLIQLSRRERPYNYLTLSAAGRAALTAN